MRFPFTPRQVAVAVWAYGAGAAAGSYAVITSMQRGNVAVNNTFATGTSTIGAVTVAQASLRYLGYSANDASGSTGYPIRSTLTNTTTITSTRIGTSGDSTVEYEVDEKV